MVENSTPHRWQQLEDNYRRHAAAMDEVDLLREVRMSWFQGLMNHPMWREDGIRLEALRQECERRGLKPRFETLEGEMRDDLRRQGRLAGTGDESS
jgi:hypothetical protein